VFALRIVQSMAGDIAVAGSAMANHIRNLRGLRTGNHKDVIRRIPPFSMHHPLNDGRFNPAVCRLEPHP
jgi:hypothetical protein